RRSSDLHSRFLKRMTLRAHVGEYRTVIRDRMGEKRLGIQSTGFPVRGPSRGWEELCGPRPPQCKQLQWLALTTPTQSALIGAPNQPIPEDGCPQVRRLICP